MKQYLPTIILLFLCNFVMAQFHPNAKADNLSKEFIKPTRIDFFDTVIFNMSKAVINGEFIDIPVSIKADDDIVALDFALKFDEATLKYNSIVNHTGHISVTDFYNQSDLTLRLLSWSLTRYDKDTVKIVSIRYKMVSQKLLCNSLFSITTWLNGDPCSYKIICPDGSVIVKNNELISDELVNIYPNPATESTTIESPVNASLEILNLNGKKLYFESEIPANQKHELNIQNLTNGVYFVRVFNSNYSSIKKLVINR